MSKRPHSEEHSALQAPDFLAELEALSDATWRAVTVRADKVTGTRVALPPFLPATETVAESRFSANFPVLRHLDRALELARESELGPLTDLFASVLATLRWSQNPSYTPENCARSFLDGYAYAAFSGPQGPIRVDAPRGGFMLMGPEVLYADHHHAPREVYLVLTPGAQWRLDRGDWFDVAPGDLILHDRWQMHAFRTSSEPLLAFAGWMEKGKRLEIGFARPPSANAGA